MDTEDPGDSLLELEESPYLRRQRQVAVRRTMLDRGKAGRLKKLVLAALPVGVLGLAGYQVVAFALNDARFAVSEHRVEVSGLNHVARQQIVEKFAGDVGRSIFRVPLEKRRAMLEEISWVESAAVARDWPDRLRVKVQEREPVAFLRTRTGLFLVDARGVALERPARGAFTFPVITGFAENDPPEARRERMRLFLALMEDLDREGARHSLDISEVDLRDSEDARVIVPGRDGSEAVLLHMGDSNFLARYRIYLAHIREWRQQFEKIQSIDLRYESQIVVNPDRR